MSTLIWHNKPTDKEKELDSHVWIQSSETCKKIGLGGSKECHFLENHKTDILGKFRKKVPS